MILEEDLVGKVKPGDRIRVYGVYKCLRGETTKYTGIMRSLLVATSLSSIADEIESTELSGADIQNIKKLSEKKDLMDIFINSIAPSIYGH